MKTNKELLIVNASTLLACLDAMDENTNLPTIDVEACMSQFVQCASYKPKNSYLEQGIDTVFIDQNLQREIFSNNPGLFEEIYTKMFIGLKQLVNSFEEHCCYDVSFELKYNYWKRRGKQDILLRKIA